MAVNVTVAGTAIAMDGASYKSIPGDIELAFQLDSKLLPFLYDTLAQVPSSAATSAVAYTGPAASWAPGGGVVQFGLQGGVSGSLAVVASGKLLSYKDGLDSPHNVDVALPQGNAYLKLTLQFNLSAKVATKYSDGDLGVTASGSTKDSYAITFCKAFSPATPVREALAHVFKGLVLPLNPATLELLAPNDFLLYEFDGTLLLSFGAFFGLDRVLYAGQSSVDVVKTLGSPLATLSAQTKPEIKLGVSLDFNFQYASLFEALISKTNGAARLHLYRSGNAKRSTALTAGLTLNGTTTASINSHLDTIEKSIVDAAGGAASAAGTSVQTVLTKGKDEIGKYVTEVNDKLSTWLKKANGVQLNLVAALEITEQRTMLASYSFDLNDGDAVRRAWQQAIGGNFVAALATGAVTLDIGSGLEREYQSKTSFTCNLFNLWNLTTWSQFSSQVSMVYAGNNIFHLQANVGRTLQTSSVGTMRNIDFYFTASADSSGAGMNNLAIDLHLDLTSQSDPAAIGAMATILSAIEAGPAADALARSMHDFAATAKHKKGSAQLKITIPASAYAHLNCDPYRNGKPATQSTYNDAQNYDAFTRAASDLKAWPLPQLVGAQNLPYMQSFQAWVDLNHTVSDTTNRLFTFYPIGKWPESFPGLDDGRQALVIESLKGGGQLFMNFVADLCELFVLSDVKAAGTTWNGLIDELTEAMKEDVDINFALPSALAVIRLCKPQSIAVSGPAAATAPDGHFAVTVHL